MFSMMPMFYVLSSARVLVRTIVNLGLFTVFGLSVILLLAGLIYLLLGKHSVDDDMEELRMLVKMDKK